MPYTALMQDYAIASSTDSAVSSAISSRVRASTHSPPTPLYQLDGRVVAGMGRIGTGPSRSGGQNSLMNKIPIYIVRHSEFVNFLCAAICSSVVPSGSPAPKKRPQFVCHCSVSAKTRRVDR